LHAFQPTLQEGFARAGRTDTEAFQTWAHVDVLVDDDVQRAMRPFKEYTATYQAMQRPVIVARGYRELADRLSELVPAGRMQEAVDAVPDDYIDDGWLVGPLRRIRSRASRWLDSELTGLIVRYGPQVGTDRSSAPENLDAFRAIAEAFERTRAG
jgi:alkanesulfonate monooxygenase SsuD/methylene tetrahydromethanopterin reductase-like flavin-dependent oxidoreductase (luciferase family)